MTTIRAIIVDDEPLARRGVRQLLAAHHDVDVVAEARNGQEAITLIRRHRPELVFLDVQMPEFDGFAVIREIGVANMPIVIFVTAYDEFAVRAFEAHAVDYLVKPIQEERFLEAINRTRDRLRSAEALALSTKLSSLLQTQERQRLIVSTSSGDLLLDAEEIDWIEADDYYAAVHVGSKRHLIRESLSSLDERLDSTRFVRAHRSAIVNIDRVREVRNEAGETMLILRNGARVSVSRRRREQVHQRIKRLGL